MRLWQAILVGMTLIPMHLDAHEQPSEDEAAAKLATDFCSGCHGPGGNSVSPRTPKLASQQQVYLVEEIEHLRSGVRRDKGAHSFMQGTAALLEEEMTESLARYYARQLPSPGQAGNPNQIERGRSLFEQRVEGGILPCTSCHGAHAEGAGPAPRLAGQHAEYVKLQLKAIQMHLRQVSAMHGTVVLLSRDDRNDIAAYLESL